MELPAQRPSPETSVVVYCTPSALQDALPTLHLCGWQMLLAQRVEGDHVAATLAR